MSLTLFVATHVIILTSDLSTGSLTRRLHRIDFVYSDLFFCPTAFRLLEDMCTTASGYLSANTQRTKIGTAKNQNKTKSNVTLRSATMPYGILSFGSWLEPRYIFAAGQLV